MGKRGPTGKTKKELNASGSWRAKDKIDTDRPQSGKGLKKPPEWMNDNERVIWDRLLPKAIEMKTYQKADHDSFGQMCRIFNDLLGIQEMISKHGYYQEVEIVSGKGDEISTKTVLRENPMVKTQKTLTSLYNTYSMQFGFNPLSRTRLQITPYQAAPAASPTEPGPNEDEDRKLRLMEKMGIRKTG